jgi:hypothetical protein
MWSHCSGQWCASSGHDVSEVESMDEEQVWEKQGVVWEETTGEGRGETSYAPRGWVWNDDEGAVRCFKLQHPAIAFLRGNLGAHWGGRGSFGQWDMILQQSRN